MATATMARPGLTQRFEREFSQSRKLHEQARGVFPSGVTHDLRHLEPFPIYVERASGAYKWDVDGHQLIDFWSGHGAIMLGHSHPAVVEAVQRQMGRSTHPGACHELEIEWGQCVQRLVPSAERVRFVNSGTEATMMALRLVRINTSRPRALKFVGHFHGWNDFVMPGAYAPYDGNVVPGVMPEVSTGTVLVPPNNPEAVDQALTEDPQIGCVILEPTGGHFGAVPIRGPFLKALREITTRHKRVLIFDEVISGFRVHPGGAQGHYGVTPDLTTMAKILAGGLPGGCVAGRADLLEPLAFRPGKTKMRHPGTFNANPLSAAAGITTLQIVADGQPNRQANDSARLLRKKVNDLFVKRGFDWVCYGDFSGFKLLPHYEGPAPDSDDFIPCNGAFDKLDGPKSNNLVHAFRRAMLLHGVDLPGLSGMTTAAHSEDDVEKAAQAVAGSVQMLKEERIS